MDEAGVHVVTGDFGDGAHPGGAHDDGVAAHVAEARRVALHPGVEDLHRVVLGNRPGHHPGLAARAVQKDVHLTLSLLACVGEELFLDDDFGVLPHHGAGVALGVVHASNLAGVHGDAGALLEIEDGLGI